jgi:amino acid transporter
MTRFLKRTWEKIARSTILGRVLVVVIVLLVLAIAMVLSGPKPPGDFDPFAPTPTPDALEITGTIIPAPSIPSTEYKLTNGVVLAVVSVVLIVFVGTIIYVLRYRKQDQE